MKKLPEKIWLDADSCWTEKPQGKGYTEYIRKDAFIDKAIKWLEDNTWLGMDGNDEWDWTVFFESEEEDG